nr:uncharacterized protein LOC109169177 [Ipomoea batatas]
MFKFPRRSKAPATPPLITVPFALRQTRSTTIRAIIAAREAPPLPEYQQHIDILEVNFDFNGIMEDNATYVADEGRKSSLNENSEEDLDDEIGDFPENSRIAVENLRTQDPEYTPSLPTDHRAATRFRTVVMVDKFVHSVVYEFYANLVPELIRFGQAYVRGHMYAFNPMVINQFFGLFDCDVGYTEDMDVVTRRLTGGTQIRWVKKDTIKAVELTSTFVYLHKIVYFNWMPTTQKGYVPRAMIVLLFKIASGIRGFEKDASEFYEAESKLIKANHRLITSTHIDDLVGPNDHAGLSSAVDTTSVTVAFLENELRLIHDHRQMLSTREARITRLLSTLCQNTHMGTLQIVTLLLLLMNLWLFEN